MALGAGSRPSSPAQDEQQILTAGPLSGSLGCATFSAGVHDDDIFFFEIHRDGELLVAGAVPDPAEYFDLGDEFDDDQREPQPPLDPSAVVGALGRGDVERVRAALSGHVVFASERHRALAEALGLPTEPVGWGYRYLGTEPEAWDGPPLSSW